MWVTETSPLFDVDFDSQLGFHASNINIAYYNNVLLVITVPLPNTLAAIIYVEIMSHVEGLQQQLSKISRDM